MRRHSIGADALPDALKQVIADGTATRPPRRRRRRRIAPIDGLAFLVAGTLLFLAILGELITPYGSLTQDVAASLQGPSSAHLLGTDMLGRDVFSRVVTGAREAFVGPVVIALGSMILGNILGLWAGYRGGKVDSIIMRWVDLMWSVPGLLVLIVVSAVFGGGRWVAIAVLVCLTVPFDTRVIRGATLEQASRPYVEAVKVLGVRDRRIMFLHIWPNVAPVAVANTFLVFAGSLVALAGLAYLGFGVEPGTPDWGSMVADNQNLIFVNPIVVLAPAAAIVLTATSMNIIGDWFYERLSSKGATR